MSAESRFYQSFRDSMLRSINTFQPCRVISYDDAKKLCEVEPLFMSVDEAGNTQKQAVLIMVPVLTHVGALKENDLVFCAFAQRALDHLQIKPFNPQSTRMFALTDAVVIGKWEGSY